MKDFLWKFSINARLYRALAVQPAKSGIWQEMALRRPVIPNSLLLSRYQRISRGIYDNLPGFKGCKCSPKTGTMVNCWKWGFLRVLKADRTGLQLNNFFLPNLYDLQPRSYNKPYIVMRYIKLIPIAVFLIMLSCCKKSAEETALVLSQTEVSEGEPFIAKVVHAPAGARFIWQIPFGVGIKQCSSDSSMVKLAFFSYNRK